MRAISKLEKDAEMYETHIRKELDKTFESWIQEREKLMTELWDTMDWEWRENIGKEEKLARENMELRAQLNEALRRAE